MKFGHFDDERLTMGEMKRRVVDAAVAVDATIDALDPKFLSWIETEGKLFRLNRAGHREHHLEQIEKALP